MYVSTVNNIGSGGARVLSQCLRHLTQLTHLDLSGECVIVCILMCVTWFVYILISHIDVCNV